MNLHMTARPELLAVWAISPLQQSVLHAMHLATTSRERNRQGGTADMLRGVITDLGRKGCHGG
jgi:hypothetical protein